jgi:hypothetical protein
MRYFFITNEGRESLTTTARQYGSLMVDLDQVQCVQLINGRFIDITLTSGVVIQHRTDDADEVYRKISADLLNLLPESE